MTNCNNIRDYISAPRLHRYEQICDNHTGHALKLYQTNLRVSQAFYPILSLFEIILRNAIDKEMSTFLNDQDWLKNQKNNLIHRSTNPQTGRPVKNDYLKKKIDGILKNNPSATNGKIISELSFGFWTDLFQPKFFPLVQGRPMHIFNHLPPSTNRSNISRRLKEIKSFRNRIYHNEPIIFQRTQNGQETFDIQFCINIYQELKDFFSYFGIDFKTCTQKIDNVMFEIERSKHVRNLYPNGIYYPHRIILGLKHYKNKYL